MIKRPYTLDFYLLGVLNLYTRYIVYARVSLGDVGFWLDFHIHNISGLDQISITVLELAGVLGLELVRTSLDESR